jgi:hypothetical protein
VPSRTKTRLVIEDDSERVRPGKPARFFLPL